MFNGRAKSEKMRVCTCQSKGCSSGKDPYGVGRMDEKGVLISQQGYANHQKADNRMQVLKRVSALRPDRMTTIDQNGLPSPPNLLGSPALENTPQPSRYQALRSPALRQISTNQRLCNQPFNSTDPSISLRRSDLDEDVDMMDSAAEIVKIDTSACFNRNFTLTEPVIIHAALVTAMLSIFEHASVHTSAWMLSAQQDQIELTIKEYHPDPLLYLNKLRGAIPQHIGTVISWLKVDPKLTLFICCPSCFALYRKSEAPARCVHTSASVLGLIDANVDDDLRDQEPIPSSSKTKLPTQCSQALFKDEDRKKPIRQCAFQNFRTWLARFICRPSTEELLDQSLLESRKPFNPDDPVHDIHESFAWKDFRDDDGTQFTSKSGNVTFGLFIDGINPFGNKTAGRKVSITFVVLVCLTLPYEMRFLPENIFLVSIAPGPHEPALEQTNWILSPIVLELQSLWDSGLTLSRTPMHPEGRLIRAALLPVIADLPALRRSLGLAGVRSKNFCSFCHLPIQDVNNIDQTSWEPRTSSEHKKWAFESRDAGSWEKRSKIFKDRGVRYSVLLELKYWKLIDYQVIDSMHNILLGLINWHVRWFWSMSDETDTNAEGDPFSSSELRALLTTDLAPLPVLEEDEQLADRSEPLSDTESPILNFRDLPAFNSDTDPSDDDFDPLLFEGWNGTWTKPDEIRIEFDKPMLAKINEIIKRICIPTWIRRAIPYLGKASFGKLKADEWRTLMTIQLPLILVPIWSSTLHDTQLKSSLLKNFAHLVSLTNLALKRTMTAERIKLFRHHTHRYLESSLVLFPHCGLATNHHMVIHLAECLEKFGPVRSWWSYPFERLMRRILLANQNNHVGELEITFMKNFGRAGYLSALLKDGDFPQELDPYLPQLRSLLSPTSSTRKTDPIHDLQPLNEDTLLQLIDNLNSNQSERRCWLSSQQWSTLSPAGRRGYSPVVSQAKFHKRYKHGSQSDVKFSTFSVEPSDAVVQVLIKSTGITKFGKIISIFTHGRVPVVGQDVIYDTWVWIEYFKPIPPGKPNPCELLDEPHMQVHLFLNKCHSPELIKITEIVANCSFVAYTPGVIHPALDVSTIALISTDRE